MARPRIIDRIVKETRAYVLILRRRLTALSRVSCSGCTGRATTVSD